MTEPCRCLRGMLNDDDEPGARARCERHQLFGRKEPDGSITASAQPMPQRLLAIDDVPPKDWR
jgi:hypothetical protein